MVLSHEEPEVRTYLRPVPAIQSPNKLAQQPCSKKKKVEIKEKN